MQAAPRLWETGNRTASVASCGVPGLRLTDIAEVEQTTGRQPKKIAAAAAALLHFPVRLVFPELSPLMDGRGRERQHPSGANETRETINK